MFFNTPGRGKGKITAGIGSNPATPTQHEHPLSALASMVDIIS